MMPISRSMRPASRAQVTAGLAPCRASVPDRSRNASSIDSGSTSGVTDSINSLTWRPVSVYFFISGRITVASGQAASALNIGIAERTPYIRAT